MIQLAKCRVIVVLIVGVILYVNMWNF